MKLKDLIKQLNALKKVHGGDLPCVSINCVSSQLCPIKSLSLVYPLGSNGCYDRSKNPVRVEFKNL